MLVSLVLDQSNAQVASAAVIAKNDLPPSLDEILKEFSSTNINDSVSA